MIILETNSNIKSSETKSNPNSIFRNEKQRQLRNAIGTHKNSLKDCAIVLIFIQNELNSSLFKKTKLEQSTLNLNNQCSVFLIKEIIHTAN